MDGEFIETPFQNFEEIPQTMAATETITNLPKITRPPLKMASLKYEKAVIEEGGSTIWGQLPDIPYKSDKFGLGFPSGAQMVVRRARAGRPLLRINNHGLNALEDDDEDSDIDSWICPTTNGGPSKWIAKDFVPITFVQQ